MLAEMAKQDLERLEAAGVRVPFDKVVALNDLAVRIERGKNTTVANLPRFAFAGNVVLHEPTVGMLEWWHSFGRDAAWTTRGKLDVYYFALAHAQRAEAFDGLEQAADIRRAVRRWKRGVFATDGELWRALLWVKTGEHAALPETPSAAVESTVVEDAVIDRLWASVIAAAGALSLRPEDLRTQTMDSLTALLVSANLHAKIPVKTSIAKDYIAYKLLLKEIEADGGRK